MYVYIYIYICVCEYICMYVCMYAYGLYMTIICLTVINQVKTEFRLISHFSLPIIRVKEIQIIHYAQCIRLPRWNELLLFSEVFLHSISLLYRSHLSLIFSPSLLLPLILLEYKLSASAPFSTQRVDSWGQCTVFSRLQWHQPLPCYACRPFRYELS